MIEKLLPCGSVVKLREAEKKLLIIGITVENGDSNEAYDYIAVPYPEGYIDQETMLLFNHDDIEEIEFIGFVNAEFQVFRSEYSEKYIKMNR